MLYFISLYGGNLSKNHLFLNFVTKVVHKQKLNENLIINMGKVPLSFPFDCPPNRTVSSRGGKKRFQ